jgi:rod shape-determining protein MreD
MPSRSYTSRRELEEYHFSLLVTLLVPFILLLLQVLLPRLVPRLAALLDLPVLAVVYFSVARRSPIAGTATGTAIGLLQDALSGQPIGVHGMADALIGYAASSIGIQVDVDALTTRILMIFGFSLFNSVLLLLIHRNLLGDAHFPLAWLREVVRAVLNSAIAIPLFLVLDRFRQRD